MIDLLIYTLNLQMPHKLADRHIHYLNNGAVTCVPYNAAKLSSERPLKILFRLTDSLKRSRLDKPSPSRFQVAPFFIFLLAVRVKLIISFCWRARRRLLSPDQSPILKYVCVRVVIRDRTRTHVNLEKVVYVYDLRINGHTGDFYFHSKKYFISRRN